MALSVQVATIALCDSCEEVSPPLLTHRPPVRFCVVVCSDVDLSLKATEILQISPSKMEIKATRRSSASQARTGQRRSEIWSAGREIQARDLHPLTPRAPCGRTRPSLASPSTAASRRHPSTNEIALLGADKRPAFLGKKSAEKRFRDAGAKPPPNGQSSGPCPLALVWRRHPLAPFKSTRAKGGP